MQGLPVLKRLLLILLLGVSPGLFAAKHQLAMTFDDLPFVDIDHQPAGSVRQRLDHLLGTLKKHDIPAIGFINESSLYIKGQPDEDRLAMVKQWLASGLTLGNHTRSHVSLNRVSVEDFKKDILRGEQLSRPLAREYNRPLSYFRHPYLHVGADLKTRRQLESFLKQHNYTVAPVTINNSDWIFSLAYEQALESDDPALQTRVVDAYLDYLDALFEYSEALSFELFGRNIRQVLLLHLNPLNTDHIEQIVQRIRQRDYGFVSLQQALEDPAYATEDDYAGTSNDSWLHHWAITAGLRPAKEPPVPRFIRRLAGPRGQKKY